MIMNKRGKRERQMRERERGKRQREREREKETERIWRRCDDDHVSPMIIDMYRYIFLYCCNK